MGIDTDAPSAPLHIASNSAALKITRNGKEFSFNANYAAGNAYSTISMTSGMDIRWTLGGADRIVFKSAGHIEPQTDSQINLGSNSVRFANVYADTLYGDGSNLTGITGTTINNNADNRIITGSGTANTLEGESNVNINGGILIAGHTASTTVSDGEGPFIQVKSTDSRGGISLLRHSANAAGGGIYIGKSRNATIGSNTIVQDDDELGRITFSGDDGNDIHTQAAAIKAYVDGTPGGNNMPGSLRFLSLIHISEPTRPY